MGVCLDKPDGDVTLTVDSFEVVEDRCRFTVCSPIPRLSPSDPTLPLFK